MVSKHGFQRRTEDSNKNVSVEGYNARQLTKNFRAKAGQGALTGCSRNSEDVGVVDRRQGSDRPPSARTDENIDQVNDMVLSQDDQPRTHIKSVKYHERRAFLSHLLSASYERICS